MDRLIVRILVGVATIIVTLIVIALLDREGQSKVERSCVDATEGETLRELTLLGIDEGYRKHIGTLFDIWVRDPHDQPGRAKIGVTNAINAYVRARRDAYAWVPTHC